MHHNPRRFALCSITVLALALLAAGSGQPQEFDEGSYVVTDLDTIYESAPKIDEGMDLFFKKVQFVATIEQAPKECVAVIISRVFKILGLGEAPAVNHCMKLRSPNGRVASVYVEDVLVKTASDELSEGQRILVYAAYLWYNGVTQQPGMLVTGFIEEPYEPADQKRDNTGD